MSDKTRNVQWRQRSKAYTSADTIDYTAGAGALPLTHPYIRVDTTSGAAAVTLADGEPGQILIIELETDAGDCDVTPATSTGWSAVALDDAGDRVTLFYANDTVGWVVLGCLGLSAQPVISA